VLCSAFNGHGTFSPALTPLGSVGGVKITFAGKLTSCAGSSTIGPPPGTPVTVTHGKVTGSGFFTGTFGSKCSNFEGAIPADAVGTITMTVKWATSPAHATTPSTVTYTAGPYAAPTPSTVNLELGAGPGTPTTVAGSYAGSAIQDTIMDIVTPPSAPCPIGPAFVFHSGKAIF